MGNIFFTKNVYAYSFTTEGIHHCTPQSTVQKQSLLLPGTVTNSIIATV